MLGGVRGVLNVTKQYSVRVGSADAGDDVDEETYVGNASSTPSTHGLGRAGPSFLRVLGFF